MEIEMEATAADEYGPPEPEDIDEHIGTMTEAEEGKAQVIEGEITPDEARPRGVQPKTERVGAKVSRAKRRAGLYALKCFAGYDLEHKLRAFQIREL